MIISVDIDTETGIPVGYITIPEAAKRCGISYMGEDILMKNKHYYICYRDYIYGGTGKFIHLFTEEEREERLESGMFNFMVELCEDGTRRYHYSSLKM